MPSLEKWQRRGQETELYLHFHPEESVIDRGELDTYSYFHPETVDAMEWIW